MKKLLILVFCVFGMFSYATQITGDTNFWTMEDFYGFDEVGDKETTLGDISSVFGRIEENNFLLRVSFDDMVLHLDDKRVIDKFAEKKMTLKFVVSAESKELINTSVNLYELSIESKNLSYKRTPQTSMAEVIIPFDGNYSKDDLIVRIKVFNNGTLADEFTSEGRNTRGGNAAFVHHGNQGLTYTEVFYGQFPQDSSGFDEVLEVHQDTGIPGNFHMSGTLMPAAEWHNPEFNDWLVDGVNDGYVAMLSSALGQHIMPFVQNEMNDWSVSVETDMVEYMYGYTPHVAWVPERVWLAPGAYPEAGVEDWLGDNWTQHGINAVILDDWPHGNGADNHKIHWMNNGSGINLRVIPIDNDFVGQMHYDANAAKSTISGTGDWGLAVYGTDWEVAAEMNEHNGTSFLDNYIDVLWYCYNNYPAVNIWKLDDAINHSDFNGWGIDVSNGTYGLLGGSDGYGGSNNSWYTHWASEPSHSDNHTPAWSYGYIWDTVYNNLMAAPDNSLSQLGWYTLMINLHETGWHDSGDISGWEHRYSSHMKNGHVFAEAARWANGDYAETTSCYFIDIDQDGGDELVIHNDKAMYVFEGIGGKANWVFYKDGLGNAYSVVGSDVSYWSETDGDYNENSYNHFAALSDVNPDQQSSVYNMTIDTASGSTVQATLDQWGVTKTITLETGNAYLDISYNFFEETGYVKSGWSPDLLDLIWSGKSHLQRMWGDYGSYCGQRNSASGATIALVLGDGGASHSGEFEGTLLKGDEISGYDVFNMRLYAGYTSDPYDVNYNKVVELDNLASETMDIIGPHVQSDALQVGSNKIQITYNEVVTSETAENTANYLLSGFSGTYNIVSAEYTHYRKVILTLDSDLSAREAGDVIVSNVMDLNDNVIDEDYDTAVLTAIVQPHLVGTINGWDPADHTYDLVLNDSGVWEVTMGLSAGSYEYKVIESDSWDSNDWPGTNQAVTLSALTLLNVKANLGMMPNARGFDEYVTHYNPVIVGSFLSLVGGTDWDPTDLTGEMTDPDGNGIYEWNVLIPVGTYDYKVALNKAWDQDTQGSGGNFSVISDGVMETVFYYDMSINSTSYASVTGSIDSPENVMLAFGVGTINLSWDSVSGANSYKVFSSDNPYTGFDLDTSGAFTDNSWLAPVSQTKKFYYVLASTE